MRRSPDEIWRISGVRRSPGEMSGLLGGIIAAAGTELSLHAGLSLKYMNFSDAPEATTLS